MRIAAFVACAAAFHIGSGPIAAQQLAPGREPKGSTLGNLFSPTSKPPSPQRFLFPTRTPALQAAPKPNVFCGLTLIPGDPNVDPAIGREVPGDNPKFMIRPVDPKICGRP